MNVLMLSNVVYTNLLLNFQADQCLRVKASKQHEHVFRPHPQLWRFLTEVSKGVAQCMLRLHHVVEVVGQRSGQSQHILIFLFSVSQHFNLGLELQVHSPGTPTETL